MKLRSFAVAAALIACAGIATSAATNATFIMTNGQRVSGELVFHGGQGNNMIDNQLNLGNAGKEQSYPMDQVAVIDVAGGNPSQDELNKALTSNQAMALRDGTVQSGQFVNIQHGDTLIWRNDSGQEQRYGLDTVARVYLNTQSARQAYNFNPTSAPSGSQVAGTSGATAAVARARRAGNAYVVQGNQPWTDTGIRVNAGDQVTFHVTGQVGVIQGGAPVGPEGKTGQTSEKYPMPTMQNGALIGRVGTGAPFSIGTQQTPIQMQSGGTLQLGINDDFFGDNNGAFAVTIQVNGRSR
ncbi:MAG TPA: hypothetical protein VH138_04110 [Vicinamibacterales bacterium]|nr:hypothetical protein [Vicinamibacterales bacterium]